MLRFLAVRVLPVPVVMLVLTFASAAENDRHVIPAEAKEILEKAESFEFLSLQPVDAPKDGFHGWKVLGRTTIKKAELRKMLVGAFEKGVAEYKEGGARCFEPRHGIRVKHDGKVAEFVICFECAGVEVYLDGKKMQTFLVSRSPAGVFNRALKDAGVPLPSAPGE